MSEELMNDEKGFTPDEDKKYKNRISTLVVYGIASLIWGALVGFGVAFGNLALTRVATWAAIGVPLSAITGFLIVLLRRNQELALWSFISLWAIGTVGRQIALFNEARIAGITEEVGDILSLMVVVLIALISVPKLIRNRAIIVAGVVISIAFFFTSLRPAPVSVGAELVGTNASISSLFILLGIGIVILILRNFPDLLQASQDSLVARLRANFITVSVIPVFLAAIILGVVAFYQARTALIDKEIEQLSVLRDERIRALNIFEESREDDLQLLADTVEALQHNAEKLYGSILEEKNEILKKEFKVWSADVIDVSSDPGVVLGAQNFQTGANTIGLAQVQLLYAGNPSLEFAGDESLYSAEHVEQHGFFSGYIDIHDYEDVFIVDPAGHVIYSANKTDVFGTNLNTGTFSDTQLARIFEDALGAGANEAVISDVGVFEAHATALFIASPIMDAQSKLVGVLIYQIEFDELTARLVQTGDVSGIDIYIVGAGENGVEFRTNQVIGSGRLGDLVNATSATNAVAGISGDDRVVREGVFELDIYQHLDLPGVEWGIVINLPVEKLFVADIDSEDETNVELLAKIADTLNFYDILLIEPSGVIFYSVEHQADYQTNLFTGPYNTTKFSTIVQDVVLREGVADQSDFERYAPSGNVPAQFFAVPLIHEGDVELIVAAQVYLDDFDAIMDHQQGLGETGETYLIGPDKLFRSSSRFNEELGVSDTILNPFVVVDTEAVRAAHAGETDVRFITDYRGVTVLSAFAPLVIDEPDVDHPEGIVWAVVAEIDESEVLQAVNALALSLAIITSVMVLLAGSIAAFIGNRLATTFSKPIVDLTEVTAIFATGDYTARVDTADRVDELGALGNSFNEMAEEIYTATTTLETRAEELNTRAQEMEASQRVTFAASERTTPEDFLNLVINLIRDVFDMYHAQVYLLSDDKTVAELRESSGYAGRVLLQRKHAIPMERTSLVTTAIKTGEAVLVTETEKDSNWLPNDLLPETKSELVVPLIQEGEVVGALDIQSRIPGYFTERSVPLFQQMTNQIAFLFDNASLISQIEGQTKSLEQVSAQLRVSAEIAARLNTINNLDDLLEEAVNQLQVRFNFYHAHVYMPDETGETLVVQAGSGHVGYTLKRNKHSIPLTAESSLVARAAREREPIVVADVTLAEGYLPNLLLPDTHSEAAIPLMLGDRLIGVLDLQDENIGRFTPADVDTLQTLAGQIASSIESAQFFEEVQAAQTRFQTVADYTFDWETWLSEEEEYLYCSPSIERITGFTPDELIDKPALFVDMVAEEDKNIVREHVHDHRSVADVDAIEYRILTKTGEERWVRHACQPVYDAQGEWIGRRGSNSDITDRKLADIEVQRVAQRFEALVDNAPDAILTLNAVERSFVDVNKRGLEMFGYSRSEFLNLSPADITTELELDGSNAAEKSMEYVQRAMQGEVISVERRMQSADGREFVVDFNLIKLPNTDNLVRGSLIDITDRKAARDTLVQGDRLKSEFLANMSHELRTPLNSIIGYTDVLLMGLDGELDDEVQEDIQAIHDNGQHLLSLINDVLDLAKIEAGRMTLEVKKVDVKGLLEDLHKKNAGLVLNKNVVMKLDIAKGLPNINGDAHRLNQVLTNLISNAVKFTEKGTITLKAFEANKEIVMQVIDTGIGIEEDDLKEIFEEFTQVDASFSRRAEGTGLGLTITQNLVKMHGGTITVESKYGKGSTFSLSIPLENVIKSEFTTVIPVKMNGTKANPKKKKGSAIA